MKTLAFARENDLKVLPQGELYPEVRAFVKSLVEAQQTGQAIAHALAYVSTELALHLAPDPLVACSDITAAIHKAMVDHQNLVVVDDVEGSDEDPDETVEEAQFGIEEGGDEEGESEELRNLLKSCKGRVH